MTSGIQRDYRQFWTTRREDDLSPEQVGETFASFLGDSIDTEIKVTSEGWADFDLDDKPRIILLAGSFGIEITAPVTWLIEEYGMEIACVRIAADRDTGRVLLNSQQVIPVPEAEEYMARRREKQERQQQSDRRRAAIHVLLENGVLVPGDIVEFCSAQKPSKEEWQIDPLAEFWQARVTGQIGRSNNVEWLYDGEEYSFTGVSNEICTSLLVGRVRRH